MTGVQTCALPISPADRSAAAERFAERLARFHAIGSLPAAAEQATCIAWLLVEAVGHAFSPEAAPAAGLGVFDTLRLRSAVAEGVRAHGAHGEHAWRLAARVRVLLVHPHAFAAAPDGAAWRDLLADPDARYALALDPTSDVPLGVPAARAPGSAAGSASARVVSFAPPEWLSIAQRLESTRARRPL